MTTLRDYLADLLKEYEAKRLDAFLEDESDIDELQEDLVDEAVSEITKKLIG